MSEHIKALLASGGYAPDVYGNGVRLYGVMRRTKDGNWFDATVVAAEVKRDFEAYERRIADKDAELDRLRRANAELQNWKDQAMAVLSQWEQARPLIEADPTVRLGDNIAEANARIMRRALDENSRLREFARYIQIAVVEAEREPFHLDGFELRRRVMAAIGKLVCVENGGGL